MQPVSRDICFFLYLKSRFKESGAIKNYPAWYAILAKEMDRSESDIRKRFSSLLQSGLIRKNRHKRIIHLCSWNTFCLKYKINKTKFLRDNRFSNLTEITHLLDAYKIDHNIYRQHLAIDKRKRSQIRKRALCGVFSPKIAKSVMKIMMKRFYSYGFEKGMRAKFSRERHSPEYKPRKGSINYNCTLSTKGTARVLGKKSASTGYRRQRIMESMGLIDVSQKLMFIKKVGSFKNFVQERNRLHLGGKFRYFRKWIVKQLPNEIKFVGHHEAFPSVVSIN